jgi:hypothetical protein
VTIERKIAAVFSMSEETWARHANPWSVWTRFTALPTLILAVWSRTWIGWWSIAAIACALLWTWMNPRLFAVPCSTNNWASKGVMGERVWLNRDLVPVPAHHRRMPNILSAVSATGLPFIVWGVSMFEIWPTLFGTALVYLGKLWFIDRMAWLYEDMKQATPEYSRWLYNSSPDQ